jgi:hypothetical protein
LVMVVARQLHPKGETAKAVTNAGTNAVTNAGLPYYRQGGGLPFFLFKNKFKEIETEACRVNVRVLACVK